ncbi:Metallo-dependent phosphatase-like protein [Schizophyllum fasciatum]
MALGWHALLQTLKIGWVFTIAYFEFWTFYRHADACEWPALHNYADDAEHVLLVADPQILDMNSYPDRHPALQWLSQVIVDLNLRKNWRAALRSRPNKIVFLGDMLDNGRMDMTDEQYAAYHRRFRSVFAGSGDTPTYFIPGNHDIGLGAPSAYSRSAQADERYITHFGAPNKIVHAGGHALVMIDAPSLVDEDRERVAAGRTFAEWPLSPNSTLAFAASLIRDLDAKIPRILLSHIPLHRAPRSSCGPLRERGTIRPGHGGGYENTIGPEASQMLLDVIKPELIFSGDDHDYCEYIHHYSGRTAQEITVKSLSMAMGVRKPGYQLLALSSPFGIANPSPSAATTPCLLPDQLHIYLGVYVPLLVISLALIGIANAAAWFRPRSLDGQGGKLRRRSSTSHRGGYAPSRGYTRLGRHRSALEAARGPLRYIAPLKHAMTCVLTSARTGKPRSLAKDILCDVRDVAVFPLLAFCIITWWSLAN